MKQHTRPSGPTTPLWVTFLPGLGGTTRYLTTPGHAIGSLTGGLAFAATGAGQAALAALLAAVLALARRSAPAGAAFPIPSSGPLT